MFIFPLSPLIPLWRGGFEASSHPGRYGQVRKCHCPPAVIRAGSSLQGRKVIKGDHFQGGICLRSGGRCFLAPGAVRVRV